MIKTYLEPYIKAYRRTVIPGSGLKPLIKNINDWQTTGDPVLVGGRPSSLWVNSSADSADRTFMMPKFSCRQKTTITHIRVRLFQFNGDNPYKLKLFRYNYNTSVYDFLSESEFHPAAVGDQYCALDTPINCEMADTPAIYVPASNSVRIQDTKTIIGCLRSSNGDINTANAFSTVNNYPMHFELFGYRPYLSITGASTQMGANGGANNNWYGSQFNGTLGTNSVTVPGGNPLSEIWSRLQSRIPTLRYQNHALSTNTFAWGLSTGVPAALAVHPKVLIVGFGLNDITEGRTWEAIEADLDAIKVLFDASTAEKLFLMEMQPRTGETDAYNATLRQFNANFKTWANNNGARVIELHDEVGQIRLSSGEIDDIKPEYNQDGVHLTHAGVDKFAEIVYRYL